MIKGFHTFFRMYLCTNIQVDPGDSPKAIMNAATKALACMYCFIFNYLCVFFSYPIFSSTYLGSKIMLDDDWITPLTFDVLVVELHMQNNVSNMFKVLFCVLCVFFKP